MQCIKMTMSRFNPRLYEVSAAVFPKRFFGQPFTFDRVGFQTNKMPTLYGFIRTSLMQIV